MLRAHLQLVWYKVDVHLILSLLCCQTLAMSHLRKLPTELLIQIFAASDTVFDAIHLSATNHFLATVWLKHSNSIIQSILEPSTPAYKEAVAQAFLETHLKSSTNGPLLLRHCLPILLRNIDLCASACLAYSTHYKGSASLPISYYFLRRVGLGYFHYQLRDDLYLGLRAMSRTALESPCSFVCWLVEHATWAEQVRQGVSEEWQRYEADILGEWETTWDCAEYVLTGAMDDIKQGTNHLVIMVEGYDPSDNDVFFEHIVDPKIML